MKTNKSISRKIFFDHIPFFAISKMAKKNFLKWEKVFKTAKNVISRKTFFDLFDFTSFFAWTFFKFAAPLCVNRIIY